MTSKTAVEDLNAEHGILLKILGVYSNYLKYDLDSFFLKEAAKIFVKFGGEYHAIQEEEYVFPVLKKEKKYIDLVNHLIYEHEEAKLLHKDLINGQINYTKLDDFIISYHKHMGEEQAIIFPMFKELVDSKKYKEIGEKFEASEQKKFRTGFNGILSQVKSVEATVATLMHRTDHDEE